MDLGIQLLQVYHWSLGSILFFIRNHLLQTPLLMVEIFWWLSSSIFLLPPVSPTLSLLDSELAAKRFLTEKVLNEMEFRILLLCPKLWDPALFSSRLLQNVLIFLLMERLGYILVRIIFLSMGESFLILTELVFLDPNLCWRRFSVEQL